MQEQERRELGDILCSRGVLLAWLLCEGDLVVGDVVVFSDVVGGHKV